MSADLGVVKRLEGEILGPESGFVVARSEKRREWEPIVQSASGISVMDKESHELAVQHGRLLQVAGKGLEELYTPLKKGIDAVKKVVLDAEKSDLAAVNEAKTALGQKVQAWTREQERVHAEEMRRAAETARREEEERRLADAIEAEQSGEKEEAERILDEPAMAAPSIVQTPQVKIAGQVSKTLYSAQVDNLMQLVQAVAKGQVPLLAIKADEAWLNGQARAFREGLNYPGVTVRSNTSTHFRG